MQVFHDSFFAMGTRLDLVIPEVGPEEGRIPAEKVRSETLRLEQKLSRFDDASELSAINRQAGAGPVRVDEEMAHILTLCLDHSRATKGAFDITLSGVGSLWAARGGQGATSDPTTAEIAMAMKSTGMEKIPWST